VYGAAGTGAVAEVRYARRDPSGRYTALERRPGTAEALDLLPHPEGGWFRQTWAAGPAFEPPGYRGERACATAIYFLLPPGAESCWHRVRSDELWLWHSDGPLELFLGGNGGQPAETGAQAAVTLGPDVGGGHRPQYVVPGGCWQSARPSGPQEVLVTCVVSPGFDFADFETAAAP
jgi:predicted cupin superfamily sugar epimerase